MVKRQELNASSKCKMKMQGEKCKIQREEYVHGGWNTSQRRSIRPRFAITSTGAGGVVDETYFSRAIVTGRRDMCEEGMIAWGNGWQMRSGNG